MTSLYIDQLKEISQTFNQLKPSKYKSQYEKILKLEQMGPFNKAIRKLLRKILTDYDNNLINNIAVVLGGSYGVGAATKTSDIEMFVFIKEAKYKPAAFDLMLKFNEELIKLNDQFNAPSRLMKLAGVTNSVPNSACLCLDFGGITPFGRMYFKDNEPNIEFDLVMTFEKYKYYLVAGDWYNRQLSLTISYGRFLWGSQELFDDFFEKTKAIRKRNINFYIWQPYISRIEVEKEGKVNSELTECTPAIYLDNKYTFKKNWFYCLPKYLYLTDWLSESWFHTLASQRFFIPINKKYMLKCDPL